MNNGNQGMLHFCSMRAIDNYLKYKIDKTYYEDEFDMNVSGFWDRLLRVNLTNSKVTDDRLGEDILRKYLGGVGIATKILFDELNTHVDPLSPENKIVFATGPFQGLGIPGGGRWIVTAKSPLTGIWGESNAGGYWGKEFKLTGYDALVIEGKADNPVYLSIQNGGVELKDASDLWGLDTYVTEKTIKKKLDDNKISIVCIGPGGENLVKFACVIADHGHGVAGRCGLGAVMGSKKLKAIAVRGEKEVDVVNEKEFKIILRKIASEIQKSRSTKYFREHGQAGYVVPLEEVGALPIKNWNMGSWKEGAEKIGAPLFTKELNIKPVGCADCPVACHRYYEVKEPKAYAYIGLGGAQYETLGMLGSNLLIDDLKAIAKANELCNRYSIDTISVGSLIGFAIECYEKGLLTEKNIGLKLNWGDPKIMLMLIQQITYRQGFGAFLAEGIKNVMNKIGKGSSDFAAQVKGMDLAAIDPRSYFSMAISIATSPRGACHLHGFSGAGEQGVFLPELGIPEPMDRFSPEKKGYLAAKYQDHAALQNSLIECLCLPFDAIVITLTDELNLLSAITGWDVTIEEIIRIGERINNLQRVFNFLHGGMTKKDDSLPNRFLTPLKEGGAANQIMPFEQMLEEYYVIRGWNKEGIPSKEKLLELGLKEASKRIYS